MEFHRKQAKALVRAYRAGEREAVARAERVLGERARQRFLLSDAQHVVAREQGHRSWPELRRSLAGLSAGRLGAIEAALDAARRGWGELGEVVLDGGIAYVEGDPVQVYVRKRGHRYRLDDRGGAIERAGRPFGWHEVARRVAEDEHWLNLSRDGVVLVPAVEGGLYLPSLALRVADASVAVYQEVLELDE
jgi:hypothetical protein